MGCVFLILLALPAYADGECANGYTLVSTDNIAFFSLVPTRSGTCDAEYVPYTTNYEISYPVAPALVANCGAGYYYNNGTCTAYATGSCDSGFVDNGTNAGSMFDYTYAGGCTPGMEPILTTHSVMRLVDTVAESVQCGAGYYYKNGTCTAYTQGSCNAGYYDETPAVDASMFDQTYAGSCLGGMDPMLTRPYASYAVVGATTRCGAGYYPTPNGCVAHATDDCPTNYYAITPATAFVRADENNECATDYTQYNDTDLCRKYLGPNMAEMCTPQLRCQSLATTLRSSTGVILPLYRERATQPSMYVLFENGDLCFANVISGAANNAVNVEYEGAVYHGVE